MLLSKWNMPPSADPIAFKVICLGGCMAGRGSSFVQVEIDDKPEKLGEWLAQPFLEYLARVGCENPRGRVFVVGVRKEKGLEFHDVGKR